MKIVNDEEKPSLEELRHTGVKGMKWGVRKKRSTTQEIIGARMRQHSRFNSFVESTGASTDPTTSAAARAAADKKAKLVERQFNTSEDRVTANRMTSGEKVLTAIGIVLTAGAAAPVVIVERTVSTALTKRSVAKARAAAN